MAGFVPKKKMSKKAQQELNRKRRVTWEFSPVTKTVESKKTYSRKRKVRNRDDYGSDFLFSCSSTAAQNSGISFLIRMIRPSVFRNTCSEVPRKITSSRTLME